MDRDDLLAAMQERCLSYADDFSRIAYLTAVTQSLLNLTMAMGMESLTRWQQEDEECLVFYAKSIKIMLENQLEQLVKILPQINDKLYSEKLAAISEQLQQVQADPRLTLLAELSKKSQELQEAQTKLAEYRKLEEEMKTADLPSLLAETRELEDKTVEYKKLLDERNKANTNMVEVASALEKVDLEASLESLLGQIDKCLAELKGRTIAREGRLQIKLDEMNDYVTSLKDIETKFKHLDNLLSIGLENIKVLRFYPDYAADEATYKDLEQKIRALDERLKNAITEREKIALKLT